MMKRAADPARIVQAAPRAGTHDAVRPLTRRIDRAHRPARRSDVATLPAIEKPRSLTAQELRRRLWHFLPGILAFAVTPIPHLDPIRFVPMLCMVVLVILIPGYFAIRYHRHYKRTDDENWAPALLGYVVPLSGMFLCFRGQVELGLAVTCVIAFGDGCATLMGLAWGRRKLPWNRRKSWVGLAAFMIGASMMGSLIYWLEAEPGVSLGLAASVVVPVALMCALIETVPSKANDNLLVGFTASLLMLVTQTLAVGWN